MTATTHLLTTERSRAQLIGVRGQWVISAYQQVTRFLGARLSPNHALLFAEPVVAANAIDWFTAAEGEIKPLARLDETGQAALLQQTRALVADIRRLSRELSASAQPDQQLIGEILDGMLVFSDQNLFLIGAQPVAAGWGLKFAEANPGGRAAAIPQAKTPRRLEPETADALSGARKPPRRPEDAPAARITRPRPVAATAAGADRAGVAPDVEISTATGAATSGWNRGGWVGLLLLLALALSIMGLRGCDGISFQWDDATRIVPRWSLFQPAATPATSEPADLLAATRRREYQLRQELARLQAEWLEKHRACAAR